MSLGLIQSAFIVKHLSEREREREKLEWRNGEVSFYQEREREKGRNQGGA